MAWQIPIGIVSMPASLVRVLCANACKNFDHANTQVHNKGEKANPLELEILSHIGLRARTTFYSR